MPGTTVSPLPEGWRTCADCGVVNPEGARVCTGCGGGRLRRDPSRAVECEYCDLENPPDALYCNGCRHAILPGVKLTEVTRLHPRDPAWRVARGRTASGFTLLAFGLAVGWIPIVMYAGSIAALVGIVLLLLGTGAFPKAHLKIVLGATALWVFNLSSALYLSWSFAKSAAVDIGVGGGALSSDLDGLILGSAALALVGGVAFVLFPLDLAGRSERSVLRFAYFLEVVYAIVLLVVLLPQVASLPLGNDGGALTSILAQFQDVGYFSAAPDFLFAFAYWRTSARVKAVPNRDVRTVGADD